MSALNEILGDIKPFEDKSFIVDSTMTFIDKG